jgi:hypothetical protein
MNGKQSQQKAGKPGKVWQATQYSNLIRHIPSGTFFARLRVGGNLIRKSLKTDLLTVARLRLADLDKNERGFAETRQVAVTHFSHQHVVFHTLFVFNRGFYQFLSRKYGTGKSRTKQKVKSLKQKAEMWTGGSGFERFGPAPVYYAPAGLQAIW